MAVSQSLQTKRLGTAPEGLRVLSSSQPAGRGRLLASDFHRKIQNKALAERLQHPLPNSTIYIIFDDLPPLRVVGLSITLHSIFIPTAVLIANSSACPRRTLFLQCLAGKALRSFTEVPMCAVCSIGIAIIRLMFWSDATHLANFGSASLWPIYLFLGNLSKYIRSAPSTRSSHHLAYIPPVSAFCCRVLTC